MGAIRKSVSVMTLGMVPFRSKKERLRQAEEAAELAELELRKEQEARSEADHRVAVADERARVAERRLLREAKAGRSRRRRDRGRSAPSAAASRVTDAVEDLVERTTKAARKDTKRSGKAAKKEAKRAAKSAKRKVVEPTGRKAKKEAKRAAKSAKKEAKAGVTKVSAVIDDAVDRADGLVNG